MLRVVLLFVSRDASCQPLQGAGVPVVSTDNLVKLQAALSGLMT